jgi:hypothetical protein
MIIMIIIIIMAIIFCKKKPDYVNLVFNFIICIYNHELAVLYFFDKRLIGQICIININFTRYFERSMH